MVIHHDIFWLTIKHKIFNTLTMDNVITTPEHIMYSMKSNIIFKKLINFKLHAADIINFLLAKFLK